MTLFYIPALLLLIEASGVSAQQPCKEYDRLIQEAQTFAKSCKTGPAMAKFNSAMQCNPAKRPEVLKMIQGMQPNNQSCALQKKDTLVAQNDPAKPVLPKNNPDDQKISGAFIMQNKELISELTSGDKAMLMADVARYEQLKQAGAIDSLKAFYELLYRARSYDTKYQSFARENLKTTTPAGFPETQSNALSHYSLRVMDAVFYTGQLDLELARKVLPASSVTEYSPKIASVKHDLESRRHSALSHYRLPDTVVGFSASVFFSGSSADNRNFAWGYSDYSDYKKLQVRYLNMSLPDLTITTDSILPLADSGMYYSMSTTAGNYKYYVARGINYLLKPNKVEYRKIEYADPPVERLLDSNQRIVMDMTGYASNAYFFSPDGSHLAGWKDGSEMAVLDVALEQQVPLKNAKPAPTGSFSTDSKKFAYYNDSLRTIYISDITGNILQEIPGDLTGIGHITNIDFTGADNFIKANNYDSISLFDIRSKKMIARLSKFLVNDLIVSPDGTEILLTCRNEYDVNGKNYQSTMGIVTDMALTVKERLYSDCGTFFYSPEGDYIIGIGEASIMRWSREKPGPAAATCLSPDELIKYKCMPLSGWTKITDADLVESEARAFLDLADEEADSMVQQVYYRESAHLFSELAFGNARLTRWERVPFFYDWYNWIERKMGHRDFGNQFVKEYTAVKEFDNLVNTRDSIYPEQLYYAADANYLLENLYDSMRVCNSDLIELTQKEIAFRNRVFVTDPENINSNNLFINAFQRLSAACDTVGSRDLMKGRYAHRRTVYASEERLLEASLPMLPDSFGLRSLYINSLVQLSSSYLYLYAGRTGRLQHAPDSALYYAEKGLALSPERFDSARFLIVEAQAYLLQPNGLERSMALYKQVRQSYPGITPKTMLNQLAYLQESGIKKTSSIQTAEEFLKTKEK